MRDFSKVLVYGILVWLVPFAVGFAAFPVKKWSPALFESIMAIAVAFSAVWFGRKYLRHLGAARKTDGVLAGLFWLGLCLALDAAIFIWGPLAMPWLDYLMDIGLTYVLIPLITWGQAAAWSDSRRVRL